MADLGGVPLEPDRTEKERDLGSLGRLVADLRGIPGGKSREIHDGLQRATTGTIVQLACLSQTLQEMDAGFNSSANKSDQEAHKNTERSQLLATILSGGLYFDWHDRESLWAAIQPVVGFDRYFGPTGPWCVQLGAMLYEKRTSFSFEATHTKLNYPSNCKLTVGEMPKPTISTFKGHSNTWQVAVVGLHRQGKTALCGRMVQALGGVSYSALGRVRSAARRHDCDDAVWYMDRSCLERREHTTKKSKTFPLFHRSVGSFDILDTPPFLNESNGKDGLIALESRRRSALHALCLGRTRCAIICVAVDAAWDTDVLKSLTAQVLAGAGPSLECIVYAVTRMDLVGWSEDAFQRVESRIDTVLANFETTNVQLTIMPTSSREPARGILFPANTTQWEKRPGFPSILAVLKTLAGEYHLSHENDFACVVDRLVRMDPLVVTANIIKGTVYLSQKLWLGDNRAGQGPHFQVARIESYHLPQDEGCCGQKVGLQLNPLTPFDMSSLSSRKLLQSMLHRGSTICARESQDPRTPVLIWLRLLDKGPLSNDFVCFPRKQQPTIANISEVLDLGVDGSTVDVLCSSFRGTYAGERLLLFRHDRLVGFGCVAGADKMQLKGYLQMKFGDPPARLVEQSVVFPPPLPPRGSSRRSISLASSMGMSVLSAITQGEETLWTQSSLLSRKARKKLSLGPASSLVEAVQQTDAVLKSVLSLQEQLERAKAALMHQGIEASLQSCYMCSSPCPPSPDPQLVPICSNCTAFNRAKCAARLRMDRVNRDNAFIVTGARIKIGYATVTRLLNEGAKLLVLTTRFPHCLAEKLVQDHPGILDSEITVHIYGVDFRSVGSVIALGSHLCKFYPKIYALINNAAQTVRRPAPFYASIVEKELELARKDGFHRVLVKEVGSDPFINATQPASHELVCSPKLDWGTAVKSFSDCEVYGACASALMTQCPVLEEDAIGLLEEHSSELFPSANQGVDAETGEMVSDMRNHSSWTKSLLPSESETDTVHPVECLETLLVNALAPFILLRALCVPLGNAQGNVINVSSREGVFARVKQAEHPHSNMSKAALNMLTRTSAFELKRINVMICSVDTGWASSRLKRRLPPLTLEDAASRILDPIAQRLDGGPETPMRTGVFWRNFKLEPYT